jgi:hypothetical protein
MARPTIVDIDYHRFLQALRRATDSGERIEPTDKKRWSSWVRDNRIKEGAFKSFANGKYQGLAPVIIDNSGEWRGYYLFSEEEEACLKWERSAA